MRFIALFYFYSTALLVAEVVFAGVVTVVVAVVAVVLAVVSAGAVVFAVASVVPFVSEEGVVDSVG